MNIVIDDLILCRLSAYGLFTAINIPILRNNKQPIAPGTDESSNIPINIPNTNLIPNWII